MILNTILWIIFLNSASAYYLNEEECLNYTVYPVQYEITLHPEISKSYYDCDITITVIASVPNVRRIELDGKDVDLRWDTVKVTYNNNVNIINEVRPYEHDRKAGKIYLYLREDLEPYRIRNRQYYIKMTFRKVLAGDENGIFVVPYQDGGQEKYMLATRLSPNKAKYFFPCFDNPQFEAVFKFRVYLPPPHGTSQCNTTLVIAEEVRRESVTILHGRGHVRIGEGYSLPPTISLQGRGTNAIFHRVTILHGRGHVRIGEGYSLPPTISLQGRGTNAIFHRLKHNFAIIEYMPSPQVATYQVGFHHSEFASKSIRARDTNDSIVIWAPAPTLPSYQYILTFGRAIMNLVNAYSTLKTPIVYGPINLVSVPAEINTYEVGSWSLLTIGDHKLSYSPLYTSINQKEQMSFLLSQQLSRIWLGNPGEQHQTKWRQQWFKEGLATYLGYYFLSQSGPSFWEKSVYGMQQRNKAMTLDWRPETPNLESFNQTLAIHIPTRYQPLVASKTASLLWMVENWLGSEKFHRALVKFINRNRGKIISVEDFMLYLHSETVECEFFKGYTVGDVLNSWFKQPGYPVVKLIVYSNAGSQDVVYLEQKQFTFSNLSRGHHTYLIPVSYTLQFTDHCYNCFQPQFTIEHSGYTFKENLHDGWIILNRNASGYYRVNYDTDTWKKIVNTLNGTDRHKIDDLNRAQIINDAFALYMSRDIDHRLATEIVSCLETESSFVVWDSAISGFELLRTEGAQRVMTKQLYSDWKSMMRDMISATYRRAHGDIARDDSSRRLRARITAFACSIGHWPCLRDLQASISQIYQNRYDPDLRETCYYTLLNQSYGYEGIKRENRFEVEDFVAAEHKAKEEIRFVYKLPNEQLRPMPLVESTTTHTTHAVTELHIASTTPSPSTTHGTSLHILMTVLIVWSVLR